MRESRVKPIWRVRFYSNGEWHRTGLHRRDSAEKVAELLRKMHALVEIYIDESEEK